MQRKALSAMKIAARAKAEKSDLGAEMFLRPTQIHTLVSVIAVANLKGGVGKSTIAVNLACELACEFAGRRTVMVVDADSQETATDWARRGELPARVETLPLDAVARVGPWVDTVLNLKADHVIIDCPPHIGPATLAAIGIADMVLIPVTASGADLVATDQALGLVHDAQAVRKDGGPLCLLVPSKVDRRTAVGRELAAALERFGEPVGPEIGQRAALVDAFTVGAWIGQYAPRNVARAQFRELANAIKWRWLMELRRLREGVEDRPRKNIASGVEFNVTSPPEAPTLR